MLDKASYIFRRIAQEQADLVGELPTQRVESADQFSHALCRVLVPVPRALKELGGPGGREILLQPLRSEQIDQDPLVGIAHGQYSQSLWPQFPVQPAKFLHRLPAVRKGAGKQISGLDPGQGRSPVLYDDFLRHRCSSHIPRLYSIPGNQCVRRSLP